MITIKQMAESYIDQIQQTLFEKQERYRSMLTEIENEINYLKNHLLECQRVVHEYSEECDSKCKKQKNKPVEVKA